MNAPDAGRPSPYELWQQAGEDPDRYRALMLEHGHLIPLKPGEKREPLPCGWPDRRVTDWRPEFNRVVTGLLGCDWGRKVSLPGNTDPCPDRAVQRIAVHDLGEPTLLQLCATHRDLLYAHTNPHAEADDAD